MMKTDSWLARDTSGSVFMSALMRASGSLDRRLWLTAAAGPVCCWLLSSSASAPRLSSSLPHRSGSRSVGVTGVTTVAAILRFNCLIFLSHRRYVKYWHAHESLPLFSYMSHMTTSVAARQHVFPAFQWKDSSDWSVTLTAGLFLSRQLILVTDWTGCESEPVNWLELTPIKTRCRLAAQKLVSHQRWFYSFRKQERGEEF